MNVLIANTADEMAVTNELIEHRSNGGRFPLPADMVYQHELTGGWVDLHSGELEPAPQDNWLDFTERWVAECRRTSQRVHYAMLAQTMSRADDQRYDWDHYRDMAVVNLQIAVAIFNGTNEARRRKLERQGGWQLGHDGERWQMASPRATVAADEIGDVLDLAETVQRQWDQAATLRAAA